MLQFLYPIQQTIVHQFFDSLIDRKNQIIQAQAASVYFFCKHAIVFKALPHQHF